MPHNTPKISKTNKLWYNIGVQDAIAKALTLNSLALDNSDDCKTLKRQILKLLKK